MILENKLYYNCCLFKKITNKIFSSVLLLAHGHHLDLIPVNVFRPFLFSFAIIIVAEVHGQNCNATGGGTT